MRRHRKIHIKKDVDRLIDDLEKLGEGATGLCKVAVYDGAGVVFDAYRAEVQKVPVDNRPFVSGGKMRNGITQKQKVGLYKACGIAKMRKAFNEVNTSIGLDGYNDIQTARWPLGEPNIMIARSVQAGTSFMERYDFVGRARRSCSAKAEAIMAATIHKEVAKRTK